MLMILPQQADGTGNLLLLSGTIGWLQILTITVCLFSKFGCLKYKNILASLIYSING
mgnify:CR=1 FL=1